MFPVADSLQQNFFLVILSLFKLGVELTDFARDRALFLQPLSNLAVDVFIKLCRLFLDIADFSADDLVELCLPDAVRRTVFLAFHFFI